MEEKHLEYMRLALGQARDAAARDEVPVGAVLVHAHSDTVLAANGNRTRQYADPTAHAEMLVLREACEKAGAQRIPDCDLYVTLEPCTMCAGAISFARVRTLYIGAPDPKGGAVLHGARFFGLPTCHHRPQVESGLCGEECARVLKDFFAARR